MTQSDSPEAGFAIEMLLARQVKGLVTATAALMAESAGDDPLEIEVELYRMLAVDCANAEQEAQALAAEPEDLPTDHYEGEAKPL